jgi:hypothetical protein
MDANAGQMARVGTTRWPLPFEHDRWAQRTRGTPDTLAAAWASFLGHIPWQWFVTLTFDPTRRFPVTRELASREAYRWCGLVGYTYRNPVAWVYAIERHKSGSHHAHVLLVGLVEKANVTAAVELWRERNGRVYAQPVAGTSRLTLYATKSASADGEIVLSDTLERYRTRLAPNITVGLVD